MIDPVTCSVKDAIRISGLGTTTLYALMKNGTIDSFTIGRKRLIKVKSLLKLLGEDPSDQSTNRPTNIVQIPVKDDDTWRKPRIVPKW